MVGRHIKVTDRCFYLGIICFAILNKKSLPDIDNNGPSGTRSVFDKKTFADDFQDSVVGRWLAAAENRCYRHKKRREINPRPTVKHKHIFQFNIGLDFFK